MPKKSAAQVGINRQALAVESSGVVAAHFEWNCGALECSALVIGAEDGRPALLISAGGQINPVRIVRVQRNTFDTEKVIVIRPDPISDGIYFWAEASQR